MYCSRLYDPQNCITTCITRPSQTRTTLCPVRKCSVAADREASCNWAPHSCDCGNSGDCGDRSGGRGSPWGCGGDGDFGDGDFGGGDTVAGVGGGVGGGGGDCGGFARACTKGTGDCEGVGGWLKGAGSGWHWWRAWIYVPG